MKSSKRLIAFVLTLCMVLTSILTVSLPVSAETTEFSDVSQDASYYEAVRVLNTFGIILGYPDGTFLPDKQVTRAEFTTMLIRAMDMEETANQSYVAANMPFEDCTNEGLSYAFPNILFAYNKGIINGMSETIFAPEDSVTYEQAVKMVVCAAGYGYVVETEEGGYPNGYLARAASMDILGNVNGTVGAPATRWQIAQLIYNAFDANMMEKVSNDSNIYVVNDKKTWLNSYLKLYEDSGMVTADNVTSISSSASTPGAGQCFIDLDTENEERTFNLGTYNVSNLIGKNVHIFYSYNESTGEYTIEYLGDLSNMTTSIVLDVDDVINFENIDIINGGTVEYWKDADSDYAKKTKLTIAPNVTLVLNGKAYSPTQAQFKNDMQTLVEGEIEFITDKNSEDVTKIFITKVDTYVAYSATVNSREGTLKVVDLYRNTSAEQKKTLEIDLEDASKTINIYDKNGKTIEASSIKKYDTLSVVESQSSAGRDLMNIYVSDSYISGTVDEVSSEGEVTINGKVYKISPYYMQYAVGNDASNEITLNTTATFYLDRNDKVTAMKKDTESYSYGYIYALGNASDSALDNDSYIIKYIDQSGTRQRVLIDYNLEYDGSRLSPAEGLYYLMDAASKTNYDKTTDEKEGVYSQLIKFSKSATGKIATIATVNSLASEYTADSLSRANIDNVQNDDGSYEAHKYAYSTSASGKFDNVIVDATTIVFVVDDAREEENIKKSTVSKEFSSATNYVVELFDQQKSYISKVCVVYKDNTQEVVTAATPVYIIAKPGNDKENNYGDIGQEASVFIGSTTFKSESVVSADQGAFSDMGQGNVVKLLENNYGDIKSVEEGSEIIWDVTTPTMPDANEWINAPAKSINGTSYRTVVGVVESFDLESGIISFIPSTDFDSIDESSKRETFRINTSSSESCGFVVYDPNDDRQEYVYSIDYADLVDDLTTYEDDPENATEVLIHLTGSSTNLIPRLIYIINRQ